MTDLTIAEMPFDERPRERMLRHGAETLSEAELVAILIGSGVRGQSAVSVARELLRDGLQALSRREWRSERVRGIGDAKAARLAAAFEIGRRVGSAGPEGREPIVDPESLARPLIARYSHYVQERLGAVYLDTRHRVIREREIYVGTLNATTVSTRDVLRHAILDHAAAIVLFHNHPSGDPAPSAEDLTFTRKMVQAAQLLGVHVLDHLIIGANRYVSLKKRGAMD